MRIAINAQLLSDAQSYRGAGVSNYSRHLLVNMGLLNQTRGTPHQLRAFIQARQFHAAGIDAVYTRWPTAHPVARIAWEQLIWPAQVAGWPADLTHGLVNVLPLTSRIPGVVTVHDLTFMRMPEKLPPLKQRYLAQLCAASVRKASQVIAVSQQTADDLMAYFGTPARKISVIHNGVTADFAPGDEQAVEQFRQARGLPARYLLYLGTLEPRKNLESLLHAFARWRRQADAEHHPVKLILAGAKGWFYETIFRQVAELGLAAWVDFPGFIPADELPNWYRAAEGFVYPSVFEGFGLPVLEAMACGTPVLCSQAPSLLEIVKESALTFPADDEAQLVAALAMLIGQPAVRRELRQRGLQRARHFTWQRTAELTLAVYEGFL
jgi:glycosyltransferase involved in cell wall biosynthesis